MLDIQYIRNNPEVARKRLNLRQGIQTGVLDTLLETDDARRHLQTQLDSVLAEANALAREIGKLYGQGKKEEAELLKAKSADLKTRTTGLEEAHEKAVQDIRAILLSIPNLPQARVPEGSDAASNKLIRKGGEMPALPEGALPHWDLAEKYGLIDFETGNKITGSGFPLYTGRGAKLQRALIQYFLDRASAAGYTEYMPPLMVNEDSGFGTGQLPDKEGQMYYVSADNYYLVPTAEVPLTNIYRDTVLKEDQLPIKMTAYTPCFRREAGSYGRDVRGLNRLHQFDKVEIVQIVHPGRSDATLEEMVDYVESLVQNLELPYRILMLCGGDMGFASAITYDFEVYAAAQEKWLEVSSVSNFESFQANRMKCRFKDTSDGKNRAVHTLNGSALALPRIVAALLENNQEKDGIRLPAVLHPYTGFAGINPIEK